MTTRKMKNSGIEWIGEIPEDWNVVPIGHLYSERKQKVSDTVYKPLSVTKQGIVPQLDSAAKSDAHDDRKLLCIGDFAINSRSDRRGSCGISGYEGSISLINTVLKPKSDMIPKYFDWLFHTTMFADEFYKWGHGIVDDLWTTNWSDMKKIMVALPSLPEQQKIADFLDEKCSHIDAVLEKTRASIEEYKQLKQSVITKAVTKGIRPNRPMKDSGIEWIGEIPEDWEIRKFKYVLSNTLQYGANESGVPYDSSLPRYIRITDITQDGKLKETDKLSLPKDVAQPFILKDGDILFARSGGTVGKSFIYKAEYEESCFAGYLIRATIKETVLPKLVYYWTCSSIYEEWKNSIFIQATIQNIGADKYSNMPIMYIRNKEEQQEIVAYLDDKCSEINTLITKKEQLIEELETYKKSLIYEYVTGKKEVC